MTESVITANSRVLLHFDIKLEDGSAVDSTRVNNKPALMQLGDGSLTSVLESHLLGLRTQQQSEFKIDGSDVFGKATPDNIQHMDRNRFSHELSLETGQIIAFSHPSGNEVPGLVRAVEGDSVTIDFNHPLSEQVLIFSVEIVKID
jgi:FKBP-type peptidyl-prolyl cis-trans isomerase SlpA